MVSLNNFKIYADRLAKTCYESNLTCLFNPKRWPFQLIVLPDNGVSAQMSLYTTTEGSKNMRMIVTTDEEMDVNVQMSGGMRIASSTLTKIIKQFKDLCYQFLILEHMAAYVDNVDPRNISMQIDAGDMEYGFDMFEEYDDEVEEEDDE